MYVEVQLNSIYRNKVWIYDTSFTQPFNLSCVFHRVLRKHKWYCPYVALRLIFSDPYWLILIHTGMSQITPLQGSVNRRATHIFWRDRGGNPKSELWDRSTVQILRKSWRHFTCKVYGRNCWLGTITEFKLKICHSCELLSCCYLNDHQWGLRYTLVIWRHSRLTSHFHNRIKCF